MTQRTNRQWRLAARPVNWIKPSDFDWHEEETPSPAEGQILVRVTHLSLDPTNRGWVNDVETYMPPVAIGEVMRGIGIGIVEESRHARFRAGMRVQGLLGWQHFALSDGSGLDVLPGEPGLTAEACLSVFGHIGLTSYFGLLDIGKPKPGETLVVSAAAGAVGSLVGQIGKIHGLRVVGIAGSETKCRWITEELGFDEAINYRNEPVRERLRQLCPRGIDIYFENVGGEILEAVLDCISLHARIVVCGLISQYNLSEPPPGPRNLANILLRRARMEGFIVLDYSSRASEAFAALGRWLAEGKLRYHVEVVEGLENAPSALNRLFDGSNNGKLIIHVS
jgi:NADPH-dependent curcumin reductase CurA